MRRARGFTLVELTLVLVLSAVVMSMVIVRLLGSTPRQQTVAAARELGNALAFFRERAMFDETLYALCIEPENGTYRVCRPAAGRTEQLDRAPLVRRGTLPPNIALTVLKQKGVASRRPLWIFLDGKGLLPELTLQLTHAKGAVVLVRPGTLVNEIGYEEP